MNKYDPFQIRNATHRSWKGMALVSAYLPEGLAERLALTALTHQQSRSLWIVKAVNLLLGNEEILEEDAITLLAQRVLTYWDYLQANAIENSSWNAGKELQKYIEHVKILLARRGIRKETIQKILKETRLI